MATFSKGIWNGVVFAIYFPFVEGRLLLHNL